VSPGKVSEEQEKGEDPRVVADFNEQGHKRKKNHKTSEQEADEGDRNSVED
jgi:hypothetical protein